MRFHRGIGCAALALSACATPQQVTYDVAADKTAINAAMQAYVEAIKSDSSAVQKFWTEDAVYITNGIPTQHGRVALDSLHRSAVRGSKVTEANVTVEETFVDHDTGYQIGTFVETLQPPKGAPILMRGRLLFVWRRQPDGSWKVARGIGSDGTGT